MEILQAVIDDVPSPDMDTAAPLKILVFDSVFDTFRGVIVFVRVLDGLLDTGMELQFMQTGRKVVAEEVGILQMKYVKAKALSAGEVGYIVLGVKELQDVKMGDTLTSADRPAAAAASRL